MIRSVGDVIVPGYRLELFLGRGVYGEMWAASGPGGARVALKFVTLADNQVEQAARSLGEVARRLHAHLLPISSIWMLDSEDKPIDSEGATKDSPAPQAKALLVAQPLAEGSLADRLRICLQSGATGVPPAELIQSLEDAARGIDALAPYGGHGDIKPGNILLLGDSAVLSDFCLVATLGHRRTATMMSGSLAYLAPESLQGDDPSAAADQYALAVTYCQLRTGSLPFAEAASYSDVLSERSAGKLDLSNLPEDERDVIARATSPDPKDRFATSVEMIRQLRQVCRDVSAHGVPSLVGEPSWNTALPAAQRFSTGGGSETQGFSVDKKVLVNSLLAVGLIFAVFVTAKLVMIENAMVQAVIDDRTDNIPAESVTAKEPEKEPAAVPVEQVTAPIEQAAAVDQKESTEEAAAEKPSLSEAQEPEAQDPDAQAPDAQDSEKIVHSAKKIPVEDASDISLEDPAPREDEVTEVPVLTEPAAALRREEIAPEQLAIAGHGDAAASPERLRAILGQGSNEDTSQVVSLAQSSDGRLVAAGVEDRGVSVWDVAEKKEIYSLSGHADRVYSLAFSPDNRWLASGGTSDHQVIVWNVENGSEAYRLSLHDGWITAVAFSPDGSLLASADTDGRIILCQVSTGRAVKMIDSHDEQVVHSIAFSPDGTFLATAGADQKIHLIEVATGLRSRDVGEHQGSVRSLVFSPDGLRLASAGEDNTVRLWNLKSDASPLTLEQHSDWVRDVTFSRDGRQLASCGYDGTVQIWDVADGNHIETISINPPGKQVVGVRFSPTGRYLFTANGNGTIYVILLDEE